VAWFDIVFQRLSTMLNEAIKKKERGEKCLNEVPSESWKEFQCIQFTLKSYYFDNGKKISNRLKKEHLHPVLQELDFLLENKLKKGTVSCHPNKTINSKIRVDFESNFFFS